MYGLEKVVLTSPTLSSTAETTEAHDYYNVVQQSMAYGAFHGGKDAGYVPTLGTSGDSLLDLLYEDSLQQKDWVRYQHQIRRLCGLRYFDRDLCLSVHGSDRQEIRVLHVSRGDNQEDSFTVTKHDKPVEEMYCNYNSNQHQKKLSSHPLIAVRSTSSIDYFKVHQSDENGKGTPVVLKRIHGASTTGTVHGGTIRDFSWNQYISSHGVAIEDSGMLFETDVSAMDGTHNIPSSRRSERLLDIKTKTSSTISSMGAIRCESSALHPHVTLVSWQDVLLKVDLREKNSVLSISSGQNHSTLLYDFSSRSDNMKHTCVTAFAVASRHAGASHTYAASTPSHVYLFDIRKPSKPIVTWEHNMKFPSTRVNSWYDMKSSGFHDLKFVTLRGEEDALLATNSYQGNAILLRWALSDEGEYIEFADGKISYKKIVDENKYRRCDLKFLKEGPLYFAWKPISFQRFEPILPPTLVYNNIYPAPAMPALTKWQDERNLSNQATVKCLEKEVRQLPTKKNPVCRDFGTLVLQRKWETNELALDPLLFRLGPFEEIIVGSLKHLGDPSSSTHVEKAINDDGLAFSIARQPNPACSRPESMAETKKDGSDSQADVNFQSSGYSLAFENRVRAPIHGWLFFQSQAEYSSSKDSFTEKIDGFTPDEIRLFLDELLEQVAGIPISAFEAWHILQRCLIEAQNSASQDIKCLINQLPLHTSLFARLVEEKRQENKRKDRDDSRKHCNDLSALLKQKGFFPLLYEHQNSIIVREENIGPTIAATDWKPASSLGPSRLFLEIWDSLTCSGDRQILSWTLKSPRMLSDILTNVGPLQPIEPLVAEAQRSCTDADTAWEQSIVSMKALVQSQPSDPYIPIQIYDDGKNQDMSSEAHELLKKFEDRWKKA